MRFTNVRMRISNNGWHAICELRTEWKWAFNLRFLPNCPSLFWGLVFYFCYLYFLQFFFEASGSVYKESIIAIDDILIENGECGKTTTLPDPDEIPNPKPKPKPRPKPQPKPQPKPRPRPQPKPKPPTKPKPPIVVEGNQNI